MSEHGEERLQEDAGDGDRLRMRTINKPEIGEENYLKGDYFSWRQRPISCPRRRLSRTVNYRCCALQMVLEKTSPTERG